ncbi:unnamed protein product [Phytophthora fragariaefolia]|uniref:Unnamed protein product n=1 Tax=Phytophthora fragariaefolia TaxID=1490495 RepID=A0A9W6XPC9_9STRA|nr:unnamed protein product [Phytophthora fragariaefolia]
MILRSSLSGASYGHRDGRQRRHQHAVLTIATDMCGLVANLRGKKALIFLLAQRLCSTPATTLSSTPDPVSIPASTPAPVTTLASTMDPVPVPDPASTPAPASAIGRVHPATDNSSLFRTPVPVGRGKQKRRCEDQTGGRLIPTTPHEVINLDDDSEDDEDARNDDEDFVDDDNAGSVSDAGTVDSAGENCRDEEYGINLTSADENVQDYGVMDSGDEAAKDDMVVDEDGEVLPDDVVDSGETVVDEAVEAEVEHEIQFAQRFLDEIGGEQEVLARNLTKEVLKNMSTTGWEDVVQPDTYEYMQTPYEPVVDTNSYPRLQQGYSGASAEALRRGESPLALFFYFMPVPLWQHIAVCSNEYRKEMIPQRVDEALRRYKKKRRSRPALPKKTRRDILHDLQNERSILPHEICRFFGLLIARAIMPNRERLANHWKTTDEGGIPRGTFETFLSRDRFQQISRNLHFNPNNHEQAKRDRAWKIRKLVDVLQTTFERGYIPPAHLAFDEAILPSRSSFNKMRVYLKDKPHKWGTKLFMLCSAETAFEVYCGKKQHASDAHNPDMKSGPAAVIRDLLAVFSPGPKQRGIRLVVVDRFYTSVALAIQLLMMGFYCVGTIMRNRIGYCKAVIEKKKTRPKDIERGSYKIAKSKLVPGMTAISWWDSRPVHFLSTGGSLELDRVVRRDASGEQHEVPCPV